MSIKNDAILLLERALAELQKAKGSVTSAVQQIRRAADMVEEKDLSIWCAIQLGEDPYITKMRAVGEAMNASMADTNDKEAIKKAQQLFQEAMKLGIVAESHLSQSEIAIKTDNAGGGYIGISFIEETHATLLHGKKGNDGTYYLNNLLKHLTYVRTEAHRRASKLLTALKYSETPRTAFDVLREAVDDRLLEINPTLAEQLMVAFQAVSSVKPEQWSQALTTCRRIIEGLADMLFPPCDKLHGGRKLGKEQYINRLWAYMDAALVSETNKELAKAHVDLLGLWLEKTHKVTNKGVHSKVDRIDAVKAVFHTYLIVGDLLKYLRNEPSDEKPNIHTATLDELESILSINRNIAKEIIKLRVKNQSLTLEDLKMIPGIGPKTLQMATSSFSFEKM